MLSANLLLLLLLLLLVVVVIVVIALVVADYYSVTRPVFCKMMSRKVRLPDRTRSHFLSRTSRGMFLRPRGFSCQHSPSLALNSALAILYMSLKRPRLCAVTVGNSKQWAPSGLPRASSLWQRWACQGFPAVLHVANSEIIKKRKKMLCGYKSTRTNCFGG